MTTIHESISDFVDLYFSIDLSRKEVDLIKIRCAPDNTPDELRNTVDGFRKVLAYAQKHFLKLRSRSRYELPDNLENILHLNPKEFLLLLGHPRYKMDSDTLSLILQEPPETLQFKLEHLRQRFTFSDDDLKRIHERLQPLETKRYSQIQKFKNKVRPQKFLLETTVIMIGVITLLWSLPELRNRYEKWIQLKTTEYFVAGELKDSPLPVEFASKTPPMIVEVPEQTVAQAEAEKTARSERKQPKVTEGEVWRFSFTGSAKIDLESELKSSAGKYTSESLKSSVAPGGIQYDFLVRVSDLISLKQEFEAISDSQLPELKMSWYKKKNIGHKKIPPGYVDVVIWISTI